MVSVTFAQTTGEALQIATIERVPFVMENEEGQLEGFSIELREEIAQRLWLRYEFKVETVFADMLQHVQQATTDLAIANISITAKRESVMDFSHPIFDSGLHILVRKDSEIEHDSLIYILTSVSFLRALPILIIFIVLYIMMIRRIDHKRVHELSLLWLLIGVIALTLQTYINFHHITPENPGMIVSYKQLGNYVVGAGKWTTMSKFLDLKGISYTAYDDFTDSLDALLTDEVDVIVWSAATSSYYATHEWADQVVVAGRLFAPDKLAIALTEENPLLEEINTTLLEIKEDGTYEKLKNKYFGE